MNKWSLPSKVMSPPTFVTSMLWCEPGQTVSCAQNAPFQTKQSRESEFRFCSRQCTIAYCTSLNILLLLLHWRHKSSTPCLFFRTTCSYSWCNIGRISWWVQSRRSLLAQHEDWHHLGLCGACFVCLNGMLFHLLPLSFLFAIIPSGVTRTAFKNCWL